MMPAALQNAAYRLANHGMPAHAARLHLQWLHQLRQKARTDRDFARSDEIAEQMRLLGVDTLTLDKQLHGAVREN